MEITYTPAICQDGKTDNGIVLPAPYRGQIVLRMPSFDERISFYDDAGVAMDTDGLSPEDSRKRNRALIRHVSRSVGKFFVRSTIERVSDGFKLDKLEMLQHDTDMVAVLMEISFKLVSKFNVGVVGNGDSTTSPTTSPPCTEVIPDPGTPAAS